MFINCFFPIICFALTLFARLTLRQPRVLNWAQIWKSMSPTLSAAPLTAHWPHLVSRRPLDSLPPNFYLVRLYRKFVSSRKGEKMCGILFLYFWHIFPSPFFDSNHFCFLFYFLFFFLLFSLSLTRMHSAYVCVREGTWTHVYVGVHALHKSMCTSMSLWRCHIQKASFVNNTCMQKRDRDFPQCYVFMSVSLKYHSCARLIS